MGDVFDMEALLGTYSVCFCFYTKRTLHVASEDILPLPFGSAPEKYNRISFIRHELHELQFLWPCTLT
jgi:hypothetical protein